MTKRTPFMRGGIRLATGIALAAAGALLVTNLTTDAIPDIEREVPSFEVNTTGTSSSAVVCEGSFGVLGLNSGAPNDVIPIGKPNTKMSGEAAAQTLTQDIQGETPPASNTVSGEETLSGAQAQRVLTETVSGMVASSCAEATNEQWLVGGSTSRGTSSTISLSNPGLVPATVTLTVYDENGELDGVGTTGVLVPAGAQKTVPLNGFGAGRESTAVQVVSSGSPVFATLSVHEIKDILPVGAETLNSQYSTETTLVFPGIKNVSSSAHSSEEADLEDEFPVRVRILAPGNSTQVKVTGFDADGKEHGLATQEIEKAHVTDIKIPKLSKKVTAIIVESEHPIVGGVSTSVHDNNDHDFTWMTPSTVFASGAEATAVTLKGGELILVNMSSEPAEFEVGKTEVKLAGFAAKQVKAKEVTTITGNASFAAGVIFFDSRSLATSPVIGSTQRVEEITIFTR